MRSFHILNSIENNQNIVWDKGAYSPIKETRSYGIAINTLEFYSYQQITSLNNGNTLYVIIVVIIQGNLVPLQFVPFVDKLKMHSIQGINLYYFLFKI